MDELRIAVLGPGAVGGLLAAVLVHAGARVVCVARASSADRLNREGIALSSDRFGAIDVAVRAVERLTSPVDILCVTVKATGLDEALDRVSPRSLDNAVVIPFLNGVEHVDRIRRHFPATGVVPATIRVETVRDDTGRIRQVSPFASIEVADGTSRSVTVTRLAELLRSAGFDVMSRNDERPMLWEKLAVLTPLALLTTAYDVPAGVVRTTYRTELLQVAAEVASVARSRGAAVDRDSIVAFVDRVPESMGSSMQSDAAHGRPLELEAIGGAVIRAAEDDSIDVPTLSRLVTTLRALR